MSTNTKMCKCDEYANKCICDRIDRMHHQLAARNVQLVQGVGISEGSPFFTMINNEYRMLICKTFDENAGVIVPTTYPTDPAVSLAIAYGIVRVEKDEEEIVEDVVDFMNRRVG